MGRNTNQPHVPNNINFVNPYELANPNATGFRPQNLPDVYQNNQLSAAYRDRLNRYLPGAGSDPSIQASTLRDRVQRASMLRQRLADQRMSAYLAEKQANFARTPFAPQPGGLGSYANNFRRDPSTVHIPVIQPESYDFADASLNTYEMMPQRPVRPQTANPIRRAFTSARRAPIDEALAHFGIAEPYTATLPNNEGFSEQYVNSEGYHNRRPFGRGFFNLAPRFGDPNRPFSGTFTTRPQPRQQGPGFFADNVLELVVGLVECVANLAVLDLLLEEWVVEQMDLEVVVLVGADLPLLLLLIVTIC